MNLLLTKLERLAALAQSGKRDISAIEGDNLNKEIVMMYNDLKKFIEQHTQEIKPNNE